MKRVLLLLSIIFFAQSGYTEPNNKSNDDIAELGLEDLLDIQVTSVSKKAKSLSNAAAAIYVISHDDIKRSGVTNIPDALRMAPGLYVARIDANKWAVSSRGFNGRFSNKLLVLVDGRPIYTSIFSGVYWETQDVMLEDIDRIEVIRGPGASLWGANAVNGVINIISKTSNVTQGGLLAIGGGSEERFFGALRYGGKITENTTGRMYIKGFQRDDLELETGERANDSWDSLQGGFRVDSQITEQDLFTIQGDITRIDFNQTLILPEFQPPNFQANINDSGHAIAWNVTTRVIHTFSPSSNLAAQLFYKQDRRNEGFVQGVTDTFDFDFQHNFDFLGWNDIVWGFGYRYIHSQINGNELHFYEPANNNQQIFNTFIQDEIMLIDNTLWLTLGSKFEHNDYTGFEVQPTIRAMWAPHPQHRLWGAISRAVRIPSRVERDINLVTHIQPPGSAGNPAPLPIAANISGQKDNPAEQLLAYEVGYRFSFSNSISLDVVGFYHDFKTLRTFEVDNVTIGSNVIDQNLIVDLNAKGQNYGIEIASTWRMLDWWDWNLSYTFIKSNLEESPVYTESVSPENLLSLRSSLEPWKDIHLDFWFRFVDSSSALTLSGPQFIGAYSTLDVRVAWEWSKNIEFALIGQNLLEKAHQEYVPETFSMSSEIERGAYGKLIWHF